MIVGFLAIVSAGHLPVIALVLLIQVAVFRELVNVRYSRRAFKEVPVFRSSQWGWFWTCLAYSYGHSFLQPDRYSLVRSRILALVLPYVEFGASPCTPSCSPSPF